MLLLLLKNLPPLRPDVRDMGNVLQPRVLDPATAPQVQDGELRELGNVLQPRVRDLATATQVQAGELRESCKVLQPRVRDLVTGNQVQTGELRELGNVLQPRAPSNLSSTNFGKTGPAGPPLFFHRGNMKSSRKRSRAAPELNSWLPGRQGHALKSFFY